MQVPVQKRELSPSRRLTLGIGLGSLVLIFMTIVFYRWADDFVAKQVEEMGGVFAPERGLVDNFGTVWNAWGEERAAASDAPAIPTLQFDLRRKNIAKLALKRDEALRKGFLVQASDDFVAAEIRVANGKRHKRVRAKIRLKGDLPDHLKGDKWSFRVRVTGDDQVLGMRVFSIQHPKVRGYIHEPLILEHMRREGVLAPRYEFVRVIINGCDKGIMALEEHFSKELLESQSRRESVIVRFDEALKWRTIVLMGQQIDFSAPYPLITPFQGAKVAANPMLARDLDAATGLLRGLLSKKLRPSEVFDPAIMARFLAVAEIWGAHHALFWNNLRFYFNPITGLLEPIAFDCNLQDYVFRFLPAALVSVDTTADNISSDCLADPRIRAPFLRAMHRIAADYSNTATWEREKAREQELQKVVHQEFPLVPDIEFGFFRWRAERLTRIDDDNLRTLPLMPPNYPVLLHAFVEPDADGFMLELYNLVPYGLDVTAITIAPSTVTTDVALPFAMPPTRGLRAPTPVRIQLAAPADITKVKVQVVANIQGYPIDTTTQKTHTARRYSREATAPVLPETTWDVVASAHPYLKKDGRDATLGPGNVLVQQPLILPRGVGLIVAPGTRLRFSAGAFLLARGPVQMRGTAKAPIDIGPSQVDWPGIAVLESAAPCEWTHVNLHDTRGIEFGAWRPTGSVMFYECKVKLDECTFTDNKAEDMLNLVRCEVDLHNVTVERCASDAIDMDYCKGSVVGGFVRGTGGDGVDVSGTTLDVRDTRFAQIKDKAVSSGERSTMRIAGIHVIDSGTGLASKDASRVEIENSTFQDIKYFAVIAFMKKPEYGPGHVVAAKLKISGPGVAFKAQTGSSILVDDEATTPVDFDVDALYADGPMNKHAVKSGSK